MTIPDNYRNLTLAMLIRGFNGSRLNSMFFSGEQGPADLTFANAYNYRHDESAFGPTLWGINLWQIIANDYHNSHNHPEHWYLMTREEREVMSTLTREEQKMMEDTERMSKPTTEDEE